MVLLILVIYSSEFIETKIGRQYFFDEPASNLHAAAQKIAGELPIYCKATAQLVYSTHSHYMVEPLWLEQAYIIFDRTASLGQDIIEAVSDPTRISTSKQYRTECLQTRGPINQVTFNRYWTLWTFSRHLLITTSVV